MALSRIFLLFVFACIFVGIVQIFSMYGDVTEEQKAVFHVEKLKTTYEDITNFEIFIHRSLTSVIMFIPGVGAVWGLFSARTIGLEFASVVVLNPELAEYPLFAIRHLYPFGILKLIAYSIAISRSYLLLMGIFRKKFVEQLSFTVGELGVVVGMLSIVGFVEVYLIQGIQQQLELGGDTSRYFWMLGSW